jgi:hypothetical protein
MPLLLLSGQSSPVAHFSLARDCETSLQEKEIHSQSRAAELGPQNFLDHTCNDPTQAQAFDPDKTRTILEQHMISCQPYISICLSSTPVLSANQLIIVEVTSTEKEKGRRIANEYQGPQLTMQI